MNARLRLHVGVLGAAVLLFGISAVAFSLGVFPFMARSLPATTLSITDPNEPPDPNDPNDMTGIIGYVGDWDPNDPNQDPNDPNTIPPMVHARLFAIDPNKPDDPNSFLGSQTWIPGTKLAGRYFIARMPPATYQLTVVVPGKAIEVVPDVEVELGLQTTQDFLQLAPEGVITGTIEDAQGGGISDEDVSVSLDGYIFCPVSGPNEQGQYTISNLPEGTFTVRVSSFKYAFPNPSQEIAVTEGQTVENVDFVSVPVGSVTGSVFESDGQTPIEGANVSICGLESESSSPVVKTDPNGQYLLEGIPAGEGYVVLAEMVSGEVNGTIGWASGVSVEDGETAAVDIVVPSGGISGTVAGDVTNGVASATANLGPEGSVWQVFTNQTTIEPNGHYHFTCLPAGTYDVEVKATGSAASVREDVQVLEGECTTEIDFTLVAGGAIEGRLQDPNSNPITFSGEVALVSAAPVGVNDPNRYQTATPDGSGHYRIENLRPGTYHVSGTANGYLTGGVSSVQVAQGATTEDVDITLQAETAGGRITGTVTLSGGGAASNKSMACGSTDIQTLTFGSTDPNGFYDLGPLSPGTYWVGVEPSEGYGPAILENVVVVGGETRSGQDMTLEPNQP